MYRLYDEVNETGFEDVIDYIQTLGYGDEDILNYCKSDPEIEVDENDFDLTVKNALDYITEITADKMLDDLTLKIMTKCRHLLTLTTTSLIITKRNILR